VQIDTFGAGKMLIVGVTFVLITIEVLPDVIVTGFAQLSLEVNTQYTVALLVKDGVVYVGLPLQAAPFRYHWYTGLFPPFVIVALKETVWPVQIVTFVDGDMVIAGNTELLTTILVEDEVTEAGFAQFALDTKVQ
jgi:hypothetical protein